MWRVNHWSIIINNRINDWLWPDGPGWEGGHWGQGGSPVSSQAGSHVQSSEEPHLVASHPSTHHHVFSSQGSSSHLRLKVNILINWWKIFLGFSNVESVLFSLSHLSIQKQQFTSRIYSKDALGFSDNEIHGTMTMGYWNTDLDTNKVTVYKKLLFSVSA